MVEQGPSIGFHLLWIVPLLVILAAGVTALIIWAVRASERRPYPAGPTAQFGATPPPQPPRETPLDILARRFASGEITAEEYERARDLLRGDGKT